MTPDPFDLFGMFRDKVATSVNETRREQLKATRQARKLTGEESIELLKLDLERIKSHFAQA